MLSNGTSGDVNNINFRGPAERRAPYEKMRIVAEDVAQEVLKVYRTIQYQDWVRLQAAQSGMTLQVRRATPEMLAFAENVLARPDNVKPGHPLEKIYANRVLQMQKSWPDQVQIILQAFYRNGTGDKKEKPLQAILHHLPGQWQFRIPANA
jgi:neutral ceramidase